MPKIISLEQSAALVKDGMTVMLGGFMGCGNPHGIIGAILEGGARFLTVICDDAARPGYGIARLISEGRIAHLIATHIGKNPEAGQLMVEGKMEVTLVPQGTFAERIRCGGHGLGGVLTPTGVGTDVAKGKRVIEVGGKEYLLELPLRAELALLTGHIVDTFGNIVYKGTTRNFSPLMAMAADIVAVEADNIVEAGEIEPERVITSGIFVDYIVRGAKNGR